jgi:multidrug resistance efflux pump
MESSDKNKAIELYTEEVEEILGTPPGWILSWGIILLFSIIVILFLGSWLFKYPDIIVSDITVTTENVPANLVAKSSGKITGLYASDNELVKKGQFIAVIENPAVTNDVMDLKNELTGYDSEKWLNPLLMTKISQKSFILGEIESSFSLFRSKVEEYLKYTSRDLSGNRIVSIEKQMANYKELIVQLQKQVDLQSEDLKITRNKFERDSLLFEQKVLSPSDFETSRMNLLQKNFITESARASLTNSRIQYSQLEQQVLELRIERSAENADYELSLKQLLSNLKASIAKWEQDYVLLSPVDGKVTFSRIWSLNQNISPGELVVTVVPVNQGNTIGILKLPVTGSGKVKKDQRVNVKFSNYPYMEFGMVIGRVEKISLAPDEKYYLAEVSFPEGLVSNYGKKLTFLGEMTGSAEIVTEDMRLIQRIFNPVRSLLKKHLY